LISASSTREAPRTEASALPGPLAPYIDTSPRSRNNPRLGASRSKLLGAPRRRSFRLRILFTMSNIRGR
jgi:hypothetical protein